MNSLLILVIILALLGAAIFLKYIKPSKGRYYENARRPSSELKPDRPVENDRIILAAGTSREEIRKALQQCCNIYNADVYSVLPALSELPDNRFLITFPYDITFEYFCYTLAYLNNPDNIEYTPEIRGWATLRAGDEWIAPDMERTKVMLEPLKEETHFAGLELVSENGARYRVDFISYGGLKKMDGGVLQYSEFSESTVNPAVEVKELFE